MIVSFQGNTPSSDFLKLLQKHKPLGIIMMPSNLGHTHIKETIQQLREFTQNILIDQEGGRVQRLKDYDAPPMRFFGKMAEEAGLDKARCYLSECVERIADMLNGYGINANCAPCLDILPDDPAHVIGDRAFSKNPEIVFELGKTYCETLLNKGITPIVKHLPGHGGSKGADPHIAACYDDRSVDALRALDFTPFKKIAEALGDQIWGMTNHVVYTQIDKDNPATFSPEVVSLIRDDIGFKGRLISDAIDMSALHGMDLLDVKRRVLDVGVVPLYCRGVFDETRFLLAD